MKKLVIVESPAKAKTIASVLGAGYVVRASLGHVLSDARLNHRAQITEGVCADEARALLQGFFRKKRGRSVEE